MSNQNVDIMARLDHFFDRFEGETEIVLYTLDPTHYPNAAVIARACPNVSIGPAR